MVEVLKGAREAGVNRHELPDPQDEWMLHELRSPSNATTRAAAQKVERMQRKKSGGGGGGGGGGRNPNAGGGGGGGKHGKP